MREQGIDALLVAVDDVHHPLGQPGFQEQFAQPHRGERHFFRRLQHKCVAARDGDRKHPQRYHRRKIERRNSHAHADGMPAGFAIDIGGDILQALAHDQAGNAAGEFDHFDAALHTGPRFGRGFAMLAGDQCRQFIEMLADQFAILKHDPRAIDHRRFAPLRQRGGGGLHGAIDIVGPAQRHLGDDFAGRWIKNLAPAFGRGGLPFSAA